MDRVRHARRKPGCGLAFAALVGVAVGAGIGVWHLLFVL